ITTDKFRTLRHINPALMFAKMIQMIARTKPERGAAIIPAHHLDTTTLEWQKGKEIRYLQLSEEY
ncbi:hypothetical protein C2W62_42750, partial [Candidatus Entotheonella serta]